MVTLVDGGKFAGEHSCIIHLPGSFACLPLTVVFNNQDTRQNVGLYKKMYKEKGDTLKLSLKCPLYSV